MTVNWSTYLDKAHAHVGLDSQYGVLHQAAALLTWIASVDGEGQPTYQVVNDHPDTFSATPTKITSLPNFAHRYVRDVATETPTESELCAHAKTGGIWTLYPVTARAWGAGDLAIVVVIASEIALDDMIDVSNRYHLPLMRVYCDASQGADPNFAPSLPFTSGQVSIINTWFGSLGDNGNPKYPSGLTATQVANFFGQYVPEVTDPASMSAWMQVNPRSMSIGVFADVFEYAS
jgi:hypothetical protein